MGFSAVVAIAAIYSASEQRKSAKKQAEATGRQVKAQKEQQKEQKKLADIKSARERRQLARESRIARAKIISATEGESSSKAAGVGGSVLTQSASAQGFAGQQSQVNQSIFEQGLLASTASADIASALARGQEGAAVGNLATSAYSIFK